MNLHKLFLIPSMALLISSSVAIDFNASEVNTTSETTASESAEAEVVYAPLHPTPEEVVAADPTDVVTIPDANLERKLSYKLGVAPGEITVRDMESLTKLYFYSSEISNLTGLEYAINLTDLYLGSNQITDISPLAGLTNLTGVGLSSNQITDISPVAGLTNLTRVDLDSNQITDISPLAGLTNLTELYLYRNQITDISPVAGLTNLTGVGLDSNQITDISPLAGLTNLTGVGLSSNQITDISPLAGLTNLIDLYLYRNQITDISPLAGLTNLTYLYLRSNQITDISPLAGLTNLTDLDLAIQTVDLDDITVTDSSELFYTIIDIDGNEQQVSLGSPIAGTHDMEGTWYVDTTVGDASTYFNGYVYQTVTCEALTGNDNIATLEEKTLTDEELIALFGVTSSDDLTITVDQSAVDYSAPADYPVVFSDTDGNEFTTTLTITDVLPVLSVDKDTIAINVNGSIDDILSQLELSATEITNDDLTSSVSIDDSAVDYSSVGKYDVIFTVSDEEGNEVSKTVTVIIEEDSTEIVEPETPDEVTSEDSDEVTSEDSDEVTSEDSDEDVKEMSLATTGGKFMGTLVVLLAVVIVALGLKRFIKE